MSIDRGDPVVLYDKLANRWIITEIAKDDGLQVTSQCFALSTSANAAGTYDRYEYAYPADFGNLADFPQLGVWPDAYYAAINAGALGPAAYVCAYDRNSMLNHSAVPEQHCCSATQAVSFSAVPADFDGDSPPPTPTPQGTVPGYFLNFDYNTNAMQMWRFSVDFSPTHNSHFTGPTIIPTSSDPAAGVCDFTQACDGGADPHNVCVPQLGTTQRLWTMSDKLNRRLAYRYFANDHESLVITHAVKVSSAGDQTGIRWYEIRNPGANPPTVYQQGTFAPDSSYRWMGSAAMDRQGNIAVGYSVSSASMHPAIRYTGRLKTEPANTLEAETSLIEGTGSQIPPPTPGRQEPSWGDYTTMSVDPSFDCTFWYTNEYLQTNGFPNWHTYIGSFRFSSCVDCVGDCNRNGSVTVNEIIIMVNINLGNQPITNCLRGDANGDGEISSAEITQAQNNSLNGCPAGSGPGMLVAETGDSTAETTSLTTVTEQIGSASGYRGADVTIPVSISGGGGTVVATDLDILYPTAILSNPRCTKDARLPNHTLSTSLPSAPPAPAGTTRLHTLLIDLNSAHTFTNGRNFTCTFTINANAPSGTYGLNGERNHVSDPDGNEFPSTVTNGSVRVF